MHKTKNLKERILSLALSAAMIATAMPITAFAEESVEPTQVGMITSFDKLEERFIHSLGENAPEHVYGLTVKLNTPFEEIQLPAQLSAMVQRVTIASEVAETEEPVASPLPEEEVIMDETAPEGHVLEEPGVTIQPEEEVVEETISDPLVTTESTTITKEEKVGGIEPLSSTPVTTNEKENVPVTWSSEQEYNSSEKGQIICTAQLPEGYTLAEGVQLPQIYVMVGSQARAAATFAITILVNNSNTYEGDTLQKAIDASGIGDTLTSLKITAGEVTTDDWKYLNQLDALENFEIDSAVTSVADMPTVPGNLFPNSIVSITVPQAIAIGDYTMSYRSNLTTINFPKATSLGTSVFESSTALTEVNFPEVTTIGSSAFNLCASLEVVNILKAESIGNSAFSFCTNLTTVNIPKAKIVGDASFNACTSLTTISLPNVTNIGRIAFASSTNFVTLKLGAIAPTTVATNAFENCSENRTLEFVDPDGNVLTGATLKTAIDNYMAVADTNGKWNGWTVSTLPAITVNINNTTYEGNTLQAAVGKISGGATAVTSLKISEGKMSVADWNYLKSLTAMTSFEIAEGVVVENIPNITTGSTFPLSIVTVSVPQAITIGNNAFYSCTALTTANFPKATSIGEWSFFNNIVLTSVSFPEATNLSVNAFYQCRELTSINFPKVTRIGGYCFKLCDKLVSVTFPAVTDLDVNAFYNNSKLISATFPALRNIGANAFDYCTKLTTLNLGATPPTVGADAFKYGSPNRALGFVAADGSPLTGAALTTAKNNYKNDTAVGAVANGKWYKWTIGTVELPDYTGTQATAPNSTPTIKTDTSITLASSSHCKWRNG